MKIRDPLSQQSLSSRIWPGWHDRLRALGVRVADVSADGFNEPYSFEAPSIVRAFLLPGGRVVQVHLLYLGDVDTPEELAAVVKAIAAVPEPPRASEPGRVDLADPADPPECAVAGALVAFDLKALDEGGAS